MNDDLLPVGETKDWRRGDVQTDHLWILGLFVVAIALFTIHLGNQPLRDWDEGLVAQVAREISAAPFDQFRWLFPTLWEQPYFNKPTLVHSLVAIAYTIGGVNEWTARLPGAILTACSVPMLYWIGREVFYPRLPAVFAALIYLTSLPVVRQGRLAMLDGAVLYFFLLMMGCMLRSRRDYRFALGIGLGFSLLCLTKGVMVGGLLLAIALLFLAWDTPRLLSMPSVWLGLGLGTVPAIAWYGVQWLHYGMPFLSQNLVEQSLQRVWTDVEHNQGWVGYYLVELLKYGLPWLLFLPLGLRLAWANRTLSWAKLVLVWGGIYLLAISLMETKLPWYGLPLYPAIALICGAQVATLWKDGRRIGIKQFSFIPYSRWWLGAFGLLAIASWIGVGYWRWQQGDLDIQFVLIAFALTLTTVTVLVRQQNPQFLAVLIWGTYMTLMLLMASNHWLWELNEQYPVKPVAALVQEQTPLGQPVYTSYGINRPSLNFYSNRQVIPADANQLKRLWRKEERPYFLLDKEAIALLNLKAPQVKGQIGDWRLITKART